MANLWLLVRAELLNESVDAPVVAAGVGDDLLQLLGVGGEHPPALLVHEDGPDGSGDAVPVERPVGLAVPGHPHPYLLGLLEVTRGGDLVQHEGQHDERVAEQEPLDGGAAAAVRQERAHGGVRQDLDLRNPPCLHEPAAAGALLEPGREDVVPAVAAGLPQGPEERRAGEVQPQRQLAQQLDGDGRLAPERDVDDRSGRLLVEPRRAGAVTTPATDGGATAALGFGGAATAPLDSGSGTASTSLSTTDAGSRGTGAAATTVATTPAQIVGDDPGAECTGHKQLLVAATGGHDMMDLGGSPPLLASKPHWFSVDVNVQAYVTIDNDGRKVYTKGASRQWVVDSESFSLDFLMNSIKAEFTWGLNQSASVWFFQKNLGRMWHYYKTVNYQKYLKCMQVRAGSTLL
uniref:Uncharacterized protein n=1 Tax=Oryza brachyantha TaxID=4533 RepID=J3LDM7_ORYBR